MSYKRFQQLLVKVLAVIVLLAVIGLVGQYIYRRATGYDFENNSATTDLTANVAPAEGVNNLLLVGTEKADGADASGVIMIASVDNTRGKLKLISLDPNSLLTIETQGIAKLGDAYGLGGISLLLSTVNTNYGTELASTIEIDFSKLTATIDEMGGISLNIEEAELAELNTAISALGGENATELTAAGIQTVSGAQAYAYTTIGTNHALQQQLVLTALLDKLRSETATRQLRLVQQALPELTTSLSATDIAPLIVGATLSDRVPELESVSLPLAGDWETAGVNNEYISYDLDKAAQMIYEYTTNDVKPGSASADSSANAAGATTDATDATGATTNAAGTTNGNTDANNSTTGSAAAVDPESLVEEGGWYDADTGDYYDSDGDRYHLEGDTRIYY